MNFNRMGWILAAVLTGGIVGSGFRAPGDKTGIVDMQTVFNKSNFAQSQTEVLRTMQSSRMAVIDFVRTYQYIKPEDAVRFRDLSTKDAPTPADKTQLDQIKADAQATESKYRDLSTKANPSKDDLASVELMNKNRDANGQALQAWQGEFTQELQAKQASLRDLALNKVKDAVKKVATDEGYTLIFDAVTAPYSANDITDAALKVMNK